MEHQIAEVHQKQEQLRRKFTEELCKTEAEMESSIKNILENIRAHRDNAQELVKNEEAQSQAILSLRREEFKSLRKADILGNLSRAIYTCINNKCLWNIDAMKKQLEQDISSRQTQNKNSHFQAALSE